MQSFDLSGSFRMETENIFRVLFHCFEMSQSELGGNDCTTDFNIQFFGLLLQSQCTTPTHRWNDRLPRRHGARITLVTAICPMDSLLHNSSKMPLHPTFCFESDCHLFRWISERIKLAIRSFALWPSCDSPSVIHAGEGVLSISRVLGLKAWHFWMHLAFH